LSKGELDFLQSLQDSKGKKKRVIRKEKIEKPSWVSSQVFTLSYFLFSISFLIQYFQTTTYKSN